MARFIWYEADGKVSSAMDAPEVFDDPDIDNEDLEWAQSMCREGVEVILVEDHDDTDLYDIYIGEGGVITQRTPFPELTVVGGVISGLPQGTYVRWPDGELTQVFDGVAEFESNVGGTFQFEFSHTRHYSDSFEVEYDV